MTTLPVPHILAAERLNEHGVIITFHDGKCAIYSASLLYATYPHAEPCDESAELPIDG